MPLVIEQSTTTPLVLAQSRQATLRVTQGHLLVLHIINTSNQRPAPTVTDSDGNTWFLTYHGYADAVGTAYVVASNTTALTVTVTFSGNDIVALWFGEISGQDASDPLVNIDYFENTNATTHYWAQLVDHCT